MNTRDFDYAVVGRDSGHDDAANDAPELQGTATPGRNPGPERARAFVGL